MTNCFRKVKQVYSNVSRISSLRKSYRSDIPKSITLNFTGGCDSKCVYCEVHQLQVGNDLSVERIYQLIDEMVELNIGKISLFGGEPFVRKDIWNVLEYLRSRNISVHVGTNGLLMSRFGEVEMNAIGKCVSSMSVSLDSPDPLQHDYLRGRSGAFEMTINALHKLKQLETVRIFLDTVISKVNHESIPKLIRFVYGLGLKEINFIPLNSETNFPGVDAKEGKDFLLISSLEEIDNLKAIVEESLCSSKQLGIKTNLPVLNQWMYDYFWSKTTGEFEVLKAVKDFRCVVVFENTYVSHSGDIQPCAIMPAVGNIKQSSLKAELAKIEPLKERLRKGVFPPVCKNCFCQFGPNMVFSLLSSPIKNWRRVRQLYGDMYRQND